MSQDASPPGQPLTPRDEITRQITALREEHGAFYDVLQEILFRHDPIRIHSPHADEYSPEVRAMLPLLAGCSSAAEVAAMTHRVFVRFFSEAIARQRERYEAIGAEIWERWQASEASRASRSTRRSP